MKTLLLLFFSLLFINFGNTQQSSFQSLFNGWDLSEWKVTTENPDSFSVEDGILVVKGGRAHLFYNGPIGNHDFKNFELRLKVKTMTNSNSGVYFHTQFQKSDWPQVGFEAQVNSSHSDPRKTGSLYGIASVWVPQKSEPLNLVRLDRDGEIFNQVESAPSKDGEWFDYNIKVEDNHILIKVNGKVTVDWTQPKDWTKTRRIGQGTIGLQAHDPECLVYYKDIEIKLN